MKKPLCTFVSLVVIGFSRTERKSIEVQLR